MFPRSLAVLPGLAGRWGPRRYASKVRTTEVTTGFDNSWRALSNEQKAKIAKEYAVYEAQDWHALTLEQKRAIYTIAYGVPVAVDPYEGWKILGGVLAVASVGVGMFAFGRSKANPPPRTLSPEYQQAQEEYLRSQNCNPIFGIASQKRTEVSEETLQI